MFAVNEWVAAWLAGGGGWGGWAGITFLQHDPIQAQCGACKGNWAAWRSFPRGLLRGEELGARLDGVGDLSGSVCSSSLPTTPALPEEAMLYDPPKAQEYRHCIYK